MNDIEKIIKIVIVFTFGFGLMIVVACVRGLFYNNNSKAPQLLLDLESFCSWMFDV